MPRLSISLEDWCKANNCIDLLSHLVNFNDRYLSFGSHKKIDWVCDLGHNFSTDPCKFTNPYRGDLGVFKCPYCSGQKVLKGFNDLTTTRPDLAKEWDYSKNDTSPTQITKGSHKDIWWKCSLGHSWKARVSARDYGNGCPYCTSKSRTSKPEQILYYYILKYFKDARNMATVNGISYDIYIPSRRVAIEYDGSYWHSIKDTTYKFNISKSNGISLYKITGVLEDSGLPNTIYINDNNLVLQSSSNELVYAIDKLLSSIFGIKESFSDYSQAYNFAVSRVISCKENKIKLPDSIDFSWSPLNGYDFQYASNDGADKLWLCNNGHTFKRRIDVIRRGSIKCPYCTGFMVSHLLFICRDINNYIILDIDTCELESLSELMLLKSRDLGLNIRGVSIKGNCIIASNKYISDMKTTAFRSTFNCVYNKNVVYIDGTPTFLVQDLLSIFNCGRSLEYISKVLKNYIITH